MARDPIRRLRDEIASLCNHALDLPTFFDGARRAIERAVPHDGCCWMTFDPATLLPTSHIPYRSIPPEQVPRLAQNEYSEEDFNKFSVLWMDDPHVGVLSKATEGARERSTRYRVLLQPNGFQNEMRASFGQEGGCWGGVAIYRSDRLPDFAPGDALALAEVSELMAQGIKRAVLTQVVGMVDRENSPGLILINSDGSVEAMNSSAGAWLDDLMVTSTPETGLPSIVHALSSRTRRSVSAESGVQPAQARSRTRSGGWVVMHGSLVGDGPDARVAIILEQARPPQIAPLIAEAYGLTAREQDVARLVIQGHSTAEIADQLYVSSNTVQDHLKSIFDKVGVRSRRELVTRVFSEQYAPRMGQGVPVGADGWFVS